MWVNKRRYNEFWLLKDWEFRDELTTDNFKESIKKKNEKPNDQNPKMWLCINTILLFIIIIYLRNEFVSKKYGGCKNLNTMNQSVAE